MKKSLLVFILLFSMHNVFSNNEILESCDNHLVLFETVNCDQQQFYDHVQFSVWPKKRRRSCHGGKKQKRRNKRRIRRSRV